MAPIPASNLPIAECLTLSTLTLATSNSSGGPHAAAVYFVADNDLNFYFFSDPLSQHGQDLKKRPQAAVAIHPEAQNWQEIRGLQLRGEVRSVAPGAEWELAWVFYSVKFPFVSELKDLVARNQLYVFTPHWIRLVDNRRGFGFKQEWCKTVQGGNFAPSVWEPQPIDDPQIGAERGGT